MDKGKNKSELTQAIIKLMFAIFFFDTCHYSCFYGWEICNPKF